MNYSTNLLWLTLNEPRIALKVIDARSVDRLSNGDYISEQLYQTSIQSFACQRLRSTENI